MDFDILDLRRFRTLQPWSFNFVLTRFWTLQFSFLSLKWALFQEKRKISEKLQLMEVMSLTYISFVREPSKTENKFKISWIPSNDSNVVIQLRSVTRRRHSNERSVILWLLVSSRVSFSSTTHRRAPWHRNVLLMMTRMNPLPTTASTWYHSVNLKERHKRLTYLKV